MTLDQIFDRCIPEPNSGCWLWDLSVDGDGYGVTAHEGKPNRAHRVSYLLVNGKTPPGLVLDHKCRVRSCANPDHLEPVTNRENLMRGMGRAATNIKKQFCDGGHPLSGSNLYTSSTRQRACKICRRDAMRRYRARRSITLIGKGARA